MDPPLGPPVLRRQYAIGPGSELTANQREDIRIAQETEASEARNMDNIMADQQAAHPNQGGRKSKRHRRRASRRHSRRASRRHRRRASRRHRRRASRRHRKSRR